MYSLFYIVKEIWDLPVGCPRSVANMQIKTHQIRKSEIFFKFTEYGDKYSAEFFDLLLHLYKFNLQFVFRLVQIRVRMENWENVQ